MMMIMSMNINMGCDEVQCMLMIICEVYNNNDDDISDNDDDDSKKVMIVMMMMKVILSEICITSTVTIYYSYSINSAYIKVGFIFHYLGCHR
jgi:hypothetical protein